MCYITFTDSFTEWLIAIGTVGATIVALFGDYIKSKIWYPKISIYIENKQPFIICDNKASDEDEEITIKIKIVNESNIAANRAVLSLREYQIDGHNDPPLLENNTFEDCTDKFLYPNGELLINLAVIKKHDNQESNRGNPSKDNINKQDLGYRLSLLLSEKKDLELKGEYAFHLQFNSDNVNSKKDYYIKIRMNTNTPAIASIIQEVTTLSKKDYNKLKK